MANKKFTRLFLFCFFSSLFSLSSASCSNYSFPPFETCSELRVLNSFLHWTYEPSSRRLKIAYQHTTITDYSTWVAWGINPTSKGMVGSQAIIAYPKSDGTMKVYTSPINSYAAQLKEGNLSFPVYELSASYSNGEISIFASLVLPPNTSTINHLWQDGPLHGNTLSIHALSGDHIQAIGFLNVTSGQTMTAKGYEDRKTMLRNAHGVICTISWGILMPIGVLIARYLKVFMSEPNKTQKTWFRLHRGLQSMAFLMGVAGWGTGLYLTLNFAGVEHTTHLTIGTIIFVLSIIQVIFAIFARPKPDHKHRFCWNVFHYIVGYGVLALSVANIVIGFSILHPKKQWSISYYVILGGLILSGLILEVTKRFMERRKEARDVAANGV